VSGPATSPPARKKRTVCAGEGGLVDPDELEVIDDILLHKLGDQYHRVANGLPVAVKDGKVVDLITHPIDPGEAIRF